MTFIHSAVTGGASGNDRHSNSVCTTPHVSIITVDCCSSVPVPASGTETRQPNWSDTDHQHLVKNRIAKAKIARAVNWRERPEDASATTR